MNADLALDICRRAVESGMLVMAPLLIGALVAGILAGLFQAITQLQEPALAFVPKLLALGLVLVLLGPWMLDRMRVFTVETLNLVGQLKR